VRLKSEHLLSRTLADVLFWHAADYVFMSVYLFIKRKSSSDGGGPRARVVFHLSHQKSNGTSPKHMMGRGD
jgi:hypothetical protein